MLFDKKIIIYQLSFCCFLLHINLLLIDKFWRLGSNPNDVIS